MPWRKAPQTKVGVLEAATGLIRPDITGEYQQFGVRRGLGLVVGVHLQMQVGQELDLHPGIVARDIEVTGSAGTQRLGRLPTRLTPGPCHER
jgi:hypothetical protein